MTASAPLRVVVLAVHPVTSAATRLRAMQFAQPFAAAGLELQLWSFVSDADIGRWYGPSHLGRVRTVLRGLARVPQAFVLVRSADVVVVQREALPLGPPLLERWAGRCAPVVWDVDDSVWEDAQSPTLGRLPRSLRAPAGKYDTLCRLASEVWVGSEVLARWARRRNSAVRVVPTVVDVPEDNPADPASREVCWIGSHSTGPFIEAVLPHLAADPHPPEVVVVGAHVHLPERLPARQLAWSRDVEARVLDGSRVGLYPIDTSHPLAEGKCGLKAVLYMAHGIPPVVTPTTTNAAIVRDGVHGYHASNGDDWRKGVRTLLTDDETWGRMSNSGHAHALENYSVRAWAPRLSGWLRALASRGDR